MKKQIVIGAALVLSLAAQAAVVSWDGTSTDITSLTANVNATAAGGFGPTPKRHGIRLIW